MHSALRERHTKQYGVRTIPSENERQLSPVINHNDNVISHNRVEAKREIPKLKFITHGVLTDCDMCYILQEFQ